MNRLDEAIIDSHECGNTSMFNVFSNLAKNDKRNEQLYEQLFEKDLKTTTVRLPANVIDALDALVSENGLSLSRQEAISFAVSNFIGSASAGYVVGLFDYGGSYNEILDDFINGLNCSDEVKQYIKTRASYELVEYLKND